METLRVGLIAQQFGESRSGVGTYATLLARGLVRAGHEVTVATFARMVPPANRREGLNFVAVPERSWDPTPGRFLGLGWDLRRRLGRDLDLIHFTDAREALFADPRSTPLVGTVHDAYAVAAPSTPGGLQGAYGDAWTRWAWYRTLRVLERRAYRGLRALIANSTWVADQVASAYGIDRGRLRVVRYGVPPAPAASGPRLPGTPSVFFAGGNFYRKGLPLVGRAVALLKADLPSLFVTVAGADRNASRLRGLLRRLGVEDRFDFRGRVEHDEVRRLHGRADLYVMPSRIEGYGIAFLEAMASGTPVIAGNRGGTRELVRDGENGLAVDPDDAPGLARALLRLTREPRLRDELVEGGRRTASLHDVDTMVRQTEEVYRETLGGARRAGELAAAGASR
jgi:glycosyltransferase involved in cell wall biosynthesis